MVSQYNELEGMLNLWETNVVFSPDYLKNIFEIKSGMLKKQTVKPLEMLEYQRLILSCLKHKHKIELPEFTDTELQNNFYVCDEFPMGIKITKYISKKNIDRDRAVDFFSKLRVPNNEFYIDSNPLMFTEMYEKIRTCISPGGEYQHTMFQFLFSPHAYIAYDKTKSVRMLIFADDKEKVVFLNPVYGNYDEMFVLSIIKHYIQKGYRFLHDVEDWFADDDFYKDSTSIFHSLSISLLGGSFFINFDKQYNHLLIKPEWATFTGDAATGKPCSKFLTTAENFEAKYYCEGCDEYYYRDDFDISAGMCYNCDEEECEVCGMTYYSGDFDYDNDCCYNCSRKKREREEMEDV